jgi:hypothetical protein
MVKMEYKLILFLIVGLALMLLTLKALFIASNNCVIPEQSSIPDKKVIVDFNCIKSMLISIFLLFLTLMVFRKIVVSTSEENLDD